ncbi:unnamed protein product [Urochloa humidicola]
MGLNIEKLLTPTDSPFYGIVPGNGSIPLGQVTLPVTFGTPENFRTEYIKFEVADFDTFYQAILGRPALAKFMAIPHYVYLVLKTPGPRGVISIQGDLRRSYECDREAVEFASTTQVPSSMAQVFAAAQKLKKSELEIPSKEAGPHKATLPEDVTTKDAELVEGDPSKTTKIGAELSPK